MLVQPRRRARPVQPPRDLSASYVDSSSIRVSFTTGSNDYNSSLVYWVYDASYNNKVYGSGSPLTLTNLSGGTTYYIYANVVIDGLYKATSSLFTTSTSSTGISLFNISGGYGDSGISTDGYTVYALTSTSDKYTITYTSSSSQTIYVLAVGGGGGGGRNNSGGGGGGAVVMKALTIPAGSDTITVTVGAGDPNVLGSGADTVSYSTGSSSKVTFSSNATLSITAGGGARSSTYSTAGYSGSTDGGSGSGAGMSGSKSGGSAVTTTTQSTTNSYTINANAGGAGSSSNFVNGGGGGAGTAGKSGDTLSNSHYGNGGDGILCTLTGIKNFKNYGSYYWGGGGGGSGYSGAGGNGGKGGGGGGLADANQSGSSVGYTDTSGIYTGTDGYRYVPNNTNASNGAQVYGNAGANTGGGGGGGSTGTSGGAGGSGIVVIAIPNYTTYQYSDISALPVYTAANTISSFSSASKTISGNSGSYLYGNGTYDISYSSVFQTGFEGYYAFNLSTSDSSCWATLRTYSSTTGAYVGSVSTTISSGTIAGEYLQISLPYSLVLKSYDIRPRVTDHFPNLCYIVGKNLGDTYWTVISSVNVSTTVYPTTTSVSSNTTSYKYYRLIVNSRNTNTSGDLVCVVQFNMRGSIY